jgi:hypothetical protein
MKLLHKHYIPSASTDVANTFKRVANWQPPSLHDENTIAKHSYFKNLSAITEQQLYAETNHD